MLSGSYVALVTPFKNNEIDYSSVERLIDFHLKNKTDGILLCGTTGESPSLATDERERFIQFAINKIGSKLPVMIGTGTNNLHKTISSTCRAKELCADYALVITPYYNKPNQEGMYQFFKRVAEETEIPIVIYNVPGRTGVNISAETVIRLSEIKNIVGIKEASGNLRQISKIIKDTSDEFSLMSGDDNLTLPILAVGAQGVISVTANILPEKVHNLVESYLNGKISQALELHQELFEINEKLFIDTNPIPVKEAMAMMQLIEREIRLPLWTLSPEKLNVLRNTLIHYGLI